MYMNRRGAPVVFFCVSDRECLLPKKKGNPMRIILISIAAFWLANTSPYAREISVTIYNTDLAVIKLIEDMDFTRGMQTISYTDVAERIDPTSVRLKALQGNVTIKEQDYRYDLVNSQKILQKYIDKNITVTLKGGVNVSGILQSATGDIVLKSADGKLSIIRADALERFDFPELPGGLVTRPTLFWKVNSDRDGKTPAEVSYLTSGFSWHAEYTAVVNTQETEMELSALVSLENNSGASYENALLKLVAGDIHRAQVPPAPRFGVEKTLAAESVAFQERGLFEYHLYELSGRTTIDNAEIKQLSLFSPTAAKIKKLFTYDGAKNPKDVTVNVEFVNSEKDGLGMPLPAGKVRVFKRDTDNALELVGEDSIDHTPKNEKVRLVLGNAFDLAGERRVTETRSISSHMNEQKVEISFRNHKDQPVTITAVEHFWGDWDITQKTANFVKKDAYTAEFTVTVPSNGESVISYTATNKF
jgi:hypothetical protein